MLSANDRQVPCFLKRCSMQSHQLPHNAFGHRQDVYLRSSQHQIDAQMVSDAIQSVISGATAAAKVVVLDKETFPRDKYCGDAVCTPAIRILDDMGVMKVLAENNESHFADAGGFVSPSGLSYIGEPSGCSVAQDAPSTRTRLSDWLQSGPGCSLSTAGLPGIWQGCRHSGQHQSHHILERCLTPQSHALPAAGASVEKLGEAAACAVKRTNLDFRIVQAAKRVGATYHEGFEVGRAFAPFVPISRMPNDTAPGTCAPLPKWTASDMTARTDQGYCVDVVTKAATGKRRPRGVRQGRRPLDSQLAGRPDGRWPRPGEQQPFQFRNVARAPSGM